MMIASSIIIASLLFSTTGYSSTHNREASMELSIPQHDTPRSGKTSTPRNPDTFAITVLENTPSQDPDTFAITIPTDISEDLDLEEIKEKTRQMHVTASASTILAGLTLYYACTTQSPEWIAGTMGSFCTNFLLTSMSVDSLRRDRNFLIRKRNMARQKTKED